jgi:hypothetical protein
MKYRIITDRYCGYSIQKHYLFCWRRVGTTYPSIEEAEKFIRVHCGYDKYINRNGDPVGIIAKEINASKQDQVMWKLKDE